MSFRREAHVPKGGPDGGDGGKGGDVWLIADRNVASLLAFRDHPHRRAGHGTHGQGKRKHGAGGDDLEVFVPEGTVVYDRDGQVLADLVNPGDRFLAGPGGRGGRGNSRFLSNRRRVPTFAEQGEPGDEHWLRLELKLLADVALVGFPNVGKSTLISRISAAKPKIADYPFTTLEPNLGVVSLDGREFVVADVPGLIEGAAEGRGLGHQFLRHVERARVLLVMIDLAVTAEHDPATQERILLEELGHFRGELLDRPRLLVGSRADIADPGHLEAWSGPVVSAVTGDGLTALVGALADAVDQARTTDDAPVPFVVHRPRAEGIAIERLDDGSLVVHGRTAERAVALSDVTTPEALAFVHEQLSRMGVDKALAKAGAVEGDTVRIGGFTFDYLPD